ncbi:PTS sugar transporter subunit IIB, partial [Bacillus haynesii]|uniref:PTS sugar transporter subunit IIB n=1 Tax=Bacillus haynesii TaxID=1925021 RepID=UPI0022A0F1D8|nr:PTS sugar transporter subunit IIB [Bacillus haynesii]
MSRHLKIKRYNNSCVKALLIKEEITMKKILLACSSGMSTSLLVTKMLEYAHSIGDEAKIWAVGQDQARKEKDVFTR